MKFRKFPLLSLIFACLFSACNAGRATPATATVKPEMVMTSAAQTAMARLNEMPSSTAAPTLPSALPATETPAPSATKALTSTLAATVTPTAGSQAAVSGDRAEFMADVTIPDGTNITPGATFEKTWSLKNTGTTTWTTGYALVHVGTDSIGGPTSVPLPGEVAPGVTVHLTVSLTAPTTAGKYTSYWKLTNEKKEYFGIGISGKDAFYVLINVASGGSASATVTPGGSATSTPGSGTPAVTATAGTATPTVTPGGAVVNRLSVSVDNGQVEGACPHTFKFTVSFTVIKNSTLTYQLTAGSNTPGFTFTLPGPQSQTFQAGTYSLGYTLDIASTSSGWVKFHITAPDDILSDPTDFSLTCK